MKPFGRGLLYMTRSERIDFSAFCTADQALEVLADPGEYSTEPYDAAYFIDNNDYTFKLVDGQWVVEPDCEFTKVQGLGEILFL
jgi:hypothetical protein